MNMDEERQQKRCPTARGNATVQRSTSNKRTLRGRKLKTTDLRAPNGFILFSEAIRRLQKSIWAGLPRPTALVNLRDSLRKERSNTWVTIHVAEIAKTFGKKRRSRGPNIRMSWSKYRNREPVEFGPWRQKAGKCLTQAALEGKLAVYVASEDQKTTRIPANVLRRLITSRGSLPDRAIRPSVKACDGDRTLFVLLENGCLVVEEREFGRWREAQRRKTKWPSQRSLKPITGRPTKQTQELRDAVLALMRDGVWSSRQPVAELKRRLTALGRDVPSADTLARLIDKLNDEVGDPALHRRKRARSRRSQQLHQRRPL